MAQKLLIDIIANDKSKQALNGVQKGLSRLKNSVFIRKKSCKNTQICYIPQKSLELQELFQKIAKNFNVFSNLQKT